MKTIISSSSYLPEAKNYWRETNKILFSLDFMDYGNLISAFDSLDNFESLVMVIFFEDLITGKNFDKAIAHIISGLDKSLEQNKPIYISISYFNNNHVIKSSK